MHIVLRELGNFLCGGDNGNVKLISEMWLRNNRQVFGILGIVPTVAAKKMKTLVFWSPHVLATRVLDFLTLQLPKMHWYSVADQLQDIHSAAYLGYGRHGSCHGRHFGGGAKIGWEKLKFVTYSFFNLYFSSHTIINCKAASTLCLYLMY